MGYDLRKALAALLLTSLCYAQPTAEQTTLSQGGLVDVRYGQVSVDQGGTSVVLDLPGDAEVRLDGVPIKPDDLQKRLAEGLSVVTCQQAARGTALSLEAFSDGSALPAANVTLLPWKKVYAGGETVTVLLSMAEARRMGHPPFQLRIPGIPASRQAAAGGDFAPAQRGGWKAVLRTPTSANLVNVPILINTGDKVYKGPRLSVAATQPAITDAGPLLASSRLTSIPGWVDLSYPSDLLDLSTAKLNVSAGARIASFQPRVDRSVFELVADGPGEYWLDFSISDRLGRTVRRRWPLRIQP